MIIFKDKLDGISKKVIVMEITGKEEMLKHLPDRPKFILKLYLLQVILIMIISVIILFILDLLPRFLPSIRWLASLEPYIPFSGSLFWILGGLTIVHVVWRKRDKLIARDKRTAFQKSVKYSFTGIPLVFGGIIHGFLPVSWLATKIFSFSDPQNPLTNLFETSIGKIIASVAGNPNYNDMIPRIIFSVLFLILAVVNILRTIFVLGIDNASMLYVYYPEESKIVDKKIYSIVRHPLYVSAYLIAISVVISNFSVFSIGISIIFAACFSYHIFGIEEKELIERFGDDFRKYRKTTPALIIHPKNWGSFIRFLIGREF